MDIVQRTTKGFLLEEREEGKIALLRFLDRNLNFYVSEALREEVKRTLEEQAEKGTRGIVLDMVEVGVIDSCGVGLVISACNHASSLGLGLALCRVSPFIDRVFDVMRLKRHLQVFGEEAEAIAALSSDKE